ncbi:DUF5666 domain-containing protein [Ramlibacter humi]|uniref:DUF5666 domain-containing protein n=1 Tax=Ramlibacter humi TaxID=2530451 RepID=A0A4Z0CAD3_9BURK|nr:DUF5666 domain-containing protein [Ramlibacter humi]TFZ07964.1 hypothetical protein EZ216_02010 [Ramlibacter humi]
MTRRLQFLAALLLAAMLTAVGCGGGGGSFSGDGDFAGVGSGGTGIDPGGVGSGGTGIPAASASGVGSVSGFGSIIVNGVRFDTDTATLQLQDTSELKLGMTVRVTGQLAADLVNGTATLVISAADLRGAMSSVTSGTAFEVASVPVETDPSTVFAGGLGSVADLRAGDQLQVHGLVARGEPLRATRVEKLATAQPPVVSGAVEQLDTSAKTFRIAGQVVNYAAADFPGWTVAQLAEGAVVRVRGNAPGQPLRATTVEQWYPQPLTEGLRLTVAGLVTQFTGFGSLQVDGVAVDGSAAQWTGNTRSVGVGTSLEVTGEVRDGVLVAGRVKVKHGGGLDPDAAESFSATGPVGALRSVSDFKVKGQTIDASGATFVGGTAADLLNGRKVGVTGARVVNDVLIADRVEFLP